MKNTFGNNVSVTLFGESHDSAIGAVVDGLAPGIPVDESFIAHQLTLRRPAGVTGSSRRESDRFSIVSGVYNGKTTGTPLCIMIPNEDRDSSAYASISAIARPGHADYTAQCKYHGFQDPRGGGHFSGRLTAPLVAVAAIAIQALRGRGIHIGTHILRCGGIADRTFSDLNTEIEQLNQMVFAVLDEHVKASMEQAIAAAAAGKDSVGGVLETAVIGLPAGIGEPWFDTVEGLLSHVLFSIPAVKGVEFGDGFALADSFGSKVNDCFAMESGRVVTATNHNGGVNGGITNGMPLLFRCAVKPTPSIGKEQRTVDFLNCESTTISMKGRHDPAIVHRARVVVDSVTAVVLCDLLASRFGTDWLAGNNP